MSFAGSLTSRSAKRNRATGRKKTGLAALMVAAAGVGAAALRSRGKHHEQPSTATPPAGAPTETAGGPINTAEVPRP